MYYDSQGHPLTEAQVKAIQMQNQGYGQPVQPTYGQPVQPQYGMSPQPTHPHQGMSPFRQAQQNLAQQADARKYIMLDTVNGYLIDSRTGGFVDEQGRMVSQPIYPNGVPQQPINPHVRPQVNQYGQPINPYGQQQTTPHMSQPTDQYGQPINPYGQQQTNNYGLAPASTNTYEVSVHDTTKIKGLGEEAHNMPKSKGGRRAIKTEPSNKVGEPTPNNTIANTETFNPQQTKVEKKNLDNGKSIYTHSKQLSNLNGMEIDYDQTASPQDRFGTIPNGETVSVSVYDPSFVRDIGKSIYDDSKLIDDETLLVRFRGHYGVSQEEMSDVELRSKLEERVWMQVQSATDMDNKARWTGAKRALKMIAATDNKNNPRDYVNPLMLKHIYEHLNKEIVFTKNPAKVMAKNPNVYFGTEGMQMVEDFIMYDLVNRGCTIGIDGIKGISKNELEELKNHDTKNEDENNDIKQQEPEPTVDKQEVTVITEKSIDIIDADVVDEHKEHEDNEVSQDEVTIRVELPETEDEKQEEKDNNNDTIGLDILPDETILEYGWGGLKDIKNYLDFVDLEDTCSTPSKRILNGVFLDETSKDDVMDILNKLVPIGVKDFFYNLENMLVNDTNDSSNTIAETYIINMFNRHSKTILEPVKTLDDMVDIVAGMECSTKIDKYVVYGIAANMIEEIMDVINLLDKSSYTVKDISDNFGDEYVDHIIDGLEEGIEHDTVDTYLLGKEIFINKDIDIPDTKDGEVFVSEILEGASKANNINYENVFVTNGTTLWRGLRNKTLRPFGLEGTINAVIDDDLIENKEE